MNRFYAFLILLTLSATAAMAQTVQTVRYEYDALNRLTQVSYPNNLTVIYSYDVLGNRTSVVISQAVAGQPDLTILNPALTPATVSTGGSLTATCTVSNLQSTPVSTSFRLRYYLSVDTQFDANDVEIGLFQTFNAPFSGQQVVTTVLTLPANQNGSRFILFRIDADNQVTNEVSETNNTATAGLTITNPCPTLLVSLNTIPTATTASTGSATAIVSGGQTPYVFSWSNGSTGAVLTNLAAGVYSVTVTDANGCRGMGSGIVNTNSVGSNSGFYAVYDNLYPPNETSFGTKQDLVQGNDGGYVMAGNGSENGANVATISKLNTDGSVVWIRKLVDTQDSYGTIRAHITGLAAVSDGYIALLLRRYATGQTYNTQLIKLDNTGTILNTQNIFFGTKPADFFDIVNPVRLAKTSDGGVVILASGLINGTNKGLLTKVSSTLTHQWTRTYDISGVYYQSVIQASDGGFLIAGRGSLLLKTDASGNLLWTKQLSAGSADGFYGLAQHVNGTIYAGLGNTLSWFDNSGAFLGQTAFSFSNNSYFSQMSIRSVATDATGVWLGVSNNTLNVEPPLIRLNTSGIVQIANNHGGDYLIPTADGGVLVSRSTKSFVATPNQNKLGLIKVNSQGLLGCDDLSQTISTSAVIPTVSTPSVVVGTYLPGFSQGTNTVASPAYAFANLCSGPTCQSATATLSGSQTITSGQAALFTITLTGSDPWSLTLSNGQIFNNISSSPFAFTLAPVTTTTYTLLRVANACGTGTASGSAVVTINSTSCTGMYSLRTGNWNDPAMWSCNRIPISSDVVTVSAGHIVTIPAAVTAFALSLKDYGRLVYGSGSRLRLGVSADLTTGLIGWYPFSGNANDFSGNNNHGTVSGATLTTDRYGNISNAYAFGGFNNPGYIRIANNPTLQFINTMTISLWYSLNTYAGMDGYGNEAAYGMHTLIAKDHDSGGFFSRVSGDVINNTMNNHLTNTDSRFDVSAAFAGATSNLNTWIHVVYVVSPTQVRMYKNGQLVSTTTLTTPATFTTANTKDLYLGKYRDKWYPLNGKLDDIRIYNRALTDVEVQALFQSN